MLKRIAALSLLTLAGWILPANMTRSQVTAPYLPPINNRQMERDALVFLEEARQLAQIPQQLPLAILRAKLATQLAPQNPDSWSILGGLYLLDNQAEASIKYLDKAKVLAPREPAVWFRLGNAYFQTRQYDKSIQSLQQGLKFKPNVPSALFDLGNAYLMSSQVPKAIEVYEKAYSQDSDFWYPLNNIGIIRYDEGNIDEAIRLWRACIAVDAKEAEPKMALATALYVRKGDKAQGIKLAADAVKLNLRYSETQFMRENLWGEKLIGDATKVLEDPQVKAAIVKAQETAAEIRDLGGR